jgi:hypothetical protein
MNTLSKLAFSCNVLSQLAKPLKVYTLKHALLTVGQTTKTIWYLVRAMLSSTGSMRAKCNAHAMLKQHPTVLPSKRKPSQLRSSSTSYRHIHIVMSRMKAREEASQRK